MKLVVHEVMLNKDLLGIVFQYLNTKTLFKNLRVCKYWKNAFQINLWRFNILLGDSKITDQGLSYLQGVHTINLRRCKQITDNGLSYIKGVHTIDLRFCNKITDKGLNHLKLNHLKGALIFR